MSLLTRCKFPFAASAALAAAVVMGAEVLAAPLSITGTDPGSVHAAPAQVGSNALYSGGTYAPGQDSTLSPGTTGTIFSGSSVTPPRFTPPQDSTPPANDARPSIDPPSILPDLSTARSGAKPRAVAEAAAPGATSGQNSGPPPVVAELTANTGGTTLWAGPRPEYGFVDTPEFAGMVATAGGLIVLAIALRGAQRSARV